MDDHKECTDVAKNRVGVLGSCAISTLWIQRPCFQSRLLVMKTLLATTRIYTTTTKLVTITFLESIMLLASSIVLPTIKLLAITMLLATMTIFPTMMVIALCGDYGHFHGALQSSTMATMRVMTRMRWTINWSIEP